MTLLTHTRPSASAAVTAVAPTMRTDGRDVARKRVNALALAGRYVH
jgi:hypothetical protein